VDQFTDRLPYQIIDATKWSDAHAEPFNYDGFSNPKFNLISKGNVLGFANQTGTAFIANTDYAGYAIYTGDYPIQQVKFTIKKYGVTDNGNFQLTVQSAKDFGSTTTENTYLMTDAANPDGTARTVNISDDKNVLIIGYQAINNTTPVNPQRVWLRSLRVGVITTGDEFTTADVASDVASRCNYASQTEGTLNALPLDWDASATDLLDYMAALEDSTWMVLADPSGRNYGKLFFRDWGNHTWNTRLDGNAEDQGLVVLPLYDSYATTWQNHRGLDQTTRSTAKGVGLTDPLPGKTFDFPEPAHIPEPQPDNTLAVAIK
jgi:hypothetical protein